MYLRICYCGYGRAGKDTAAILTALYTPIIYTGSLSMIVCPLIAAELGQTEEYAWKDRHNNRQYWYEWCNEFRKEDPTKLVKLQQCQGESTAGSIVVGVRDKLELISSKKASLLDLIVWVDRDVPVDKTVTYTKSDADIIIDNNGDLLEFRDRLVRLLKLITHIRTPDLQKFENVLAHVPSYINKSEFDYVIKTIKDDVIK